MDSPTRSNQEFGERAGTPGSSDLNDHRYQEPMPLVDPTTIQRRGSLNIAIPVHPRDAAGRRDTVTSTGPTTFLTPPQPEGFAGPISRDFELTHAVTDDEGNDDRGPRSPLDGKMPRRHRSRHSTRGTYDADRLDVEDIDIAVTSRSSSPPNSVDAFAEPRRRERANTADSRMPPELFVVERTISGASRSRRPTFNNSIRDLPVDLENAAEDDVCFPQEIEPTKSFTVDFEAIEEFVAQQKLNRKLSHERRHSYTSSGNNHAGKGYQPTAERVPTANSVSNSPWTQSGNVDSSSDAIDEKLVEAGWDRRGSAATDQRFSFFSSEIEQTIHVSDIGDLTMPGETMRDLFELPPDDGAWWLDVMNPTEDEMDMFQKAFGIHRLTVEDIEKQETREKVELFKQYYFVSFRSFIMDQSREDYLDPVMMYMIVFRNSILTFSYVANPHAGHVRRRIGKLRNYINLTSDWISYALVDDIVDCFAPSISEVELETDQIEDEVFTLRAEDSIPLLRKIGDCRRKVTSLMRLLGGKADVIKGFAKRCNEHYSMTPRHEIGLYLGDIQDHVVTMMSNLAAFEKVLSRGHSNYLTHLQVDHLMQGNRANQVLSKITVCATILVPMNLITGLFGMNVHIPGQGGDDYGWFCGIVGVIVGCVVIGLVVAKRCRFI